MRRIILLCAIGVILCDAAWQRGIAHAASPPAPTQTSTLSGTLDFGGRSRTYLLHVPAGAHSDKPLAVVFVLHGATQSASSAERMSGMSAKADEQHFLAVYPSGTGRLPT